MLPLLVIGVAQGATIDFIAPLGLTEDQEVPPTGSDATGTGSATLDTVALTLTVHLTWEDLTGPAGAAHIHCCPGPGVNGPVAIDFVPAGFPNVVSGTFDHTFDLTDDASYGAIFLGLFGGDVDLAREAVIDGLVNGRALLQHPHSGEPAGRDPRRHRPGDPRARGPASSGARAERGGDAAPARLGRAAGRTRVGVGPAPPRLRRAGVIASPGPLV